MCRSNSPLAEGLTVSQTDQRAMFTTPEPPVMQASTGKQLNWLLCAVKSRGLHNRQGLPDSFCHGRASFAVQAVTAGGPGCAIHNTNNTCCPLCQRAMLRSCITLLHTAGCDGHARAKEQEIFSTPPQSVRTVFSAARHQSRWAWVQAH